MWKLHTKLKLLTKRLSQWSRETIRNIHEQVINWEEKVQRLEELEIANNTEAERTETNKAHAEYISKIVEKRRRLHLDRIKNHKGKWITGEDKISKAAIRHFNGLFNLPASSLDPSILECITNRITDKENITLKDTPTEEEIKHAVFNLCAYSAAGPDDYNGTFFQSCWDIIKEDIIAFVLEFFRDRLISENILLAQEIVQSISHTNKGDNVVIKLNIVKAYDRMSWTFVTSVLWKFDFCELWFDMILNLLSGI
ncbi:uncharacterized protein [Nicotiana tomentosiformis]|uniref:uncharacterized protein n=1 Tax=Nicotiana tomentosiformis TaxID=4098 RepID=UPI00388CA430